MRLLPILLAGLAATGPASAQTWVRAVGGAQADRAHAIVQTADRGLLAVGETRSSGAGGRDVLALRIGPCGAVVWQRTYGDGLDQRALAVAITGAERAVLVGETRSATGDLDLLLVEIDLAGNVVWQAVAGGAGDETGHAVAASDDGGLVVAARSFDATTGAADVWIVRLDDQREIVWQRTLGGTGDDLASGIAAGDDRVVVVGSTDSSGAGFTDGWIVALDDLGTVVWERTYGGAGDEGFEAVAAKPDGYLVAGFTDSWGEGLFDAWCVRVDGSGDIVWQRAYGGIDDDEALSAAPDPGGWLVAGRSLSFGAGDEDGWAMRIGHGGAPAWQTRIGGVADDRIAGMSAGVGGPAFAGLVDSAGAGAGDALVGRIDAAGSPGSGCGFGSIASLASSATSATVLPATMAAAATTAPVETPSWTAAPAAGGASVVCATGPGEVSPPGAALPLAVSRAGLTWEPQAPSCVETFNVYGGTLADLVLGDHGTCVASGLAGAEHPDSSAPDPGQGFFYLVTGTAGGVEGTSGVASDGTERLPSPCR